MDYSLRYYRLSRNLVLGRAFYGCTGDVLWALDRSLAFTKKEWTCLTLYRLRLLTCIAEEL